MTTDIRVHELEAVGSGTFGPTLYDLSQVAEPIGGYPGYSRNQVSGLYVKVADSLNKDPKDMIYTLENGEFKAWEADNVFSYNELPQDYRNYLAEKSTQSDITINNSIQED